MSSRSLPVSSTRSFQTKPFSYNEENHTVQVIFTTGADVVRDGFVERLKVDERSVILDRLKAGASFLIEHEKDVRSVIGSVKDAWIKDGKGYAEIQLTRQEKHAELVRDLLDGILRNVSVGYFRHDSGQVIGENHGTQVLEFHRWEPFEISLVGVPADPGCYVRSKKTEEQEKTDRKTPPQIEKTTEGKAMACGKKTATETASKQPQEEEVKSASENRSLEERFDRFESVLTSFLQKEELQRNFEESSRRVSNGIEVGQEPIDHLKRGAVDALINRHNPKVELSDQGRNYANHTLFDVACDFVGSGLGRGRNRSEIVQRAISTTDFPELLGELSKNTIFASFNEIIENSYYKDFSEIKNLPDFNERRYHYKGRAGEFQKQPEGSEFKRYSLKTEEGEKWQLASYGGEIAFTRQAIINGEEMDIMDLATDFGTAAAKTELELVNDVFLKNQVMCDGKPLFAKHHKNLVEDAPLDAEGMHKARRTLQAQTGITDKKLGLVPKILMVGLDLELKALRFDASPLYPQLSDQVNPYAGRQKVIICPHLDNPGEWYLMAGNGQGIKHIHIGYLDGKREPQSKTYTENRTGSVVTSSWIDVAVRAMDYRGMTKCTGGDK